MIKSLLALLATLFVAYPAGSAEPVPPTLNLGDCRILAGKLHAEAFRSTLAAIDTRARAGSFDDRRKLAAIATNRFACFLETVSASAGWTVVSEGTVKDGVRGITATASQLVDADILKNRPEGLKALREAVRTAQAIADQDLAFRNIAARYVADYKEVFPPADHADAYRNAVGVKAVACRDGGSAGQGKAAANTLCAEARAAVAGLHRSLPAAKREQLETAGLAWAETYLAGEAAKSSRQGD